jgi:thiol-disulfide isomerase/thioredoxin
MAFPCEGKRVPAVAALAMEERMLARRKFIALAALGFAAVFAPPLARADPVAPFDPAAYDAALAAGKPMLVEISAPWCPTCRAQKAVLAELLVDPKFADLVHLDVDFDTRKDVVRALGARSQSTLIVYSGGAEVGRVVGEVRPAMIAALVNSAY